MALKLLTTCKLLLEFDFQKQKIQIFSFPFLFQSPFTRTSKIMIQYTSDSCLRVLNRILLPKVLKHDAPVLGLSYSPVWHLTFFQIVKTPGNGTREFPGLSNHFTRLLGLFHGQIQTQRLSSTLFNQHRLKIIRNLVFV